MVLCVVKGEEMPDYSRRSPDAVESAAGGCLFALIGLLTFGLYQGFKYRPNPYNPIAPHQPTQPQEVERKFNVNAPAALAVILVIVGCSLSQFVVGIASIFDSSDYGSPPSGSAMFVGFVGLITLWGGVIWAIAKVYERHQEQEQVDETPQKPLRMDRPKGYTIHLPRDIKPDLVHGTKMVQSLLQAMPQLTLQVEATANATSWKVVDLEGRYSPQSIIDTVSSRYDNVLVVPDEDDDKSGEERYPFYRRDLLFGLSQEYVIPISTRAMQRDDDPLVAIARRMSALQEQYDERMTYSLVMLTASYEALERGVKRIEDGSAVDWPNIDRSLQQAIKEKMAGPLYHCFLIVTIESRSEQRLDELALVANDITNGTWNGVNTIVHRAKWQWEITDVEDDKHTDLPNILKLWMTNETKGWGNMLMVLYPEEIAALWHLPNADYAATNIVWASTLLPEDVQGSEEDEDDPNRLCIGEAEGPGQNGRVYLSNADRAYHLYTTGQTGMGKSTLMHNLIHQDIQHGNCVAVLDPHGKLVDQVLASSIAADRLDDVVLLECGRSDVPVPLNPMRIPPGVSPEAVESTLYIMWQKIYDDIWLEGQTDRVIRNVIKTLLCDPLATPYDVQRLMMNPLYRKELVKKVKEKRLRSTALFWQGYNSESDVQQSNKAEPVFNRMEAFWGRPELERMTCHPHALDFKSMMAEKKIILVNLAGDAIATEMANLGVMFLTQLQMAAHSLGYLEDGEPPRCYVYIDEVERFVGSPIAEICSEARKFGLSLMFSNQYFDQLENKSLKGILGNVSTLMTFACSSAQAHALRKTYEPELDPHTLEHLSAYRMAVRTKYEGETLSAFMVKTLPPPSVEHDIDSEEIRQRSIEQNRLLTAEEVDKWLDERYFSEDDDEEPEAGDGLQDFD